MANRKRKFVLRVPVTPEERALIQQKMAQLGTKNFSAYARKMLIDGYIVHIDTGPVRAQTAELQKIGVNINQTDAATCAAIGRPAPCVIFEGSDDNPGERRMTIERWDFNPIHQAFRLGQRRIVVSGKGVIPDRRQ